MTSWTTCRASPSRICFPEINIVYKGSSWREFAPLPEPYHRVCQLFSNTCHRGATTRWHRVVAPRCHRKMVASRVEIPQDTIGAGRGAAVTKSEPAGQRAGGYTGGRADGRAGGELSRPRAVIIRAFLSGGSLSSCIPVSVSLPLPSVIILPPPGSIFLHSGRNYGNVSRHQCPTSIAVGNDDWKIHLGMIDIVTEEVVPAVCSMKSSSGSYSAGAKRNLVVVYSIVYHTAWRP